MIAVRFTAKLIDRDSANGGVCLFDTAANIDFLAEFVLWPEGAKDG